MNSVQSTYIMRRGADQRCAARRCAARVTRQMGFTLIEVLVALALTALVAALAYSALSSVIAAGERAELEARRLHDLQRAFALLERDLAQWVARPIRDELGDRQPVFSAGEVDALLRFTRAGWPNARGQQRSDLQRVRYRWQDRQLWRDYWSTLDRGPDDEPVSVVVLDALDGVRLRLLDGGADGGADGGERAWRNSWLARDSGDRLPAAIEVVLELEVWGEVRRLFVLPAG